MTIIEKSAKIFFYYRIKIIVAMIVADSDTNIILGNIADKHRVHNSSDKHNIIDNSDDN